MGNELVRRQCPCGYWWECGVHCGDGHTNGKCPPWPPQIPFCTNGCAGKIESHPFKQVVRCANCKEWLAW